MSDDLEGTLERRLRDRFEDEVGAWDGSAARRAMDTIRSQGPARSPRRLTGFLAPLAGALIVTLVVGVIVATQRPSPGPAGPVGQASVAASPIIPPHEPTPSAPTASATAAPTETIPTPSPTAPPPPVLQAGDFGLLVMEVPIFVRPDTSADPLQVLEEGRDVWASQAPEVIDGSLWYRVEFHRFQGSAGYMFAWLPGVWDGQAVIRPYQPECPERPVHIAEMAGLSPPERLYCFGSEDVRVIGVADTLDAGESFYQVRPGWMGVDAAWWFEGKRGSAGTSGAFQVHVDPALGIELLLGETVRLTGHFDDPVSSQCIREPVEGYPEPLPGEDEAWCAQRFVVTGVDRIGG